MSVLVLEKLSPGGQMATTGQVDNYPGFEDGIDGFELGEKMKKGRRPLRSRDGVRRSNQCRAPVRAEEDYHHRRRTSCEDGGDRYRRFTERTGTSGRKKLRGRGVAYCAVCDGMRYKDKTVVVSGGGNSAAEDALFLAKICKKVYLVHRRDALRFHGIPECAEGQPGRVFMEQPY